MYWGGGKQYTGFWKSNKKHGKVRACVRYARACACACACACAGRTARRPEQQQLRGTTTRRVGRAAR